MRKQFWKTALALLSVLCLTAGGKGAVCAKEEGATDVFSGDVAVLKQENNGYVMQVTVENAGEDFTGTVRAVFSGVDDLNTAYSTELTLPAQGKKQFTIRVTNTAADTTSGICELFFVDEKGEVLQSVWMKNVFGDAITEIPVGVLSDDYASLAFMRANGETVDLYGKSYPLKLTELNDGNLQENLEEVYFLLIDRFDVSSLSRENIEAIQNWVKDGGWLMIGTGEYGEQTLSGFDRDFLDVSVSSVSEPGEENVVSGYASPYGYDYYRYTDDGIDLTDMAIADLRHNGAFYESSENPDIGCAIGDGAVMIFFFSFGDPVLEKVSDYTVAAMYEEITYGNYGYQYNDYSEWDYIGRRLLSFLDDMNTDVDFTGLKIMIAVYVVLVGPVLYLVLRRLKKCEWYWVCVPALGVLFILGVYFLGQGARVKDARVYAVTAQRADSNRKDTCFMAYHSGTKPWAVPLDADYEMAGPSSAWGSYYYGSFSQNTDDYYYMVNSDSGGLSVGLKPEENFDTGFFYAEGRAESRGTISCENLRRLERGKIGGTVTNGTDCDMPYMAVWLQNNIKVFSDVKAGETIDLEEALQNGRCVYENEDYYYDDLLYDMVAIYDRQYNRGYEQDEMAALLLGIGIAEDAKPAEAEEAIVIGIVKDYDKISAGGCSETSYGCLYSYAEMGGQNASN